MAPDAEAWTHSAGSDQRILSQACRTVLLVAQEGSFSGAARHMRVRQSTVSRQVRSFEDWIGVSIFERIGAGVRVTDAGRQFLDRLDQIGGLARVALSEARDAGTARSGSLRLGFIGSFASLPAKEILGRLKALHPHLKLQLTELGSSELVRQVLAHELDCAWVATWRSPDPVLVFEPLWPEPYYLAMPADRPGEDRVRWNALSGQTLLSRPEAELDLLSAALAEARVAPPEVQIHDLSRESLVALVADGEGVAILPESFARTGRPGVRFARIDEPGAAAPISSVFRRDRDNPALRRLLAIARDWRRERLASGGRGLARE
ncbi:LysR family transcriptional regulator [Phenylobacterium sp.]|uniref:LysR family transcriptional regulator n=1 Tax=Phenylobacterium sp. TaxID=1871053 RepID=UPI003D29DCB9